tara:strand:+ start:75 stop:206 length:132 start_codon:yes stop_codon:yes gene_type:complete
MNIFNKIANIKTDLQKLQDLIEEQKQIDKDFFEAVRKFDKLKK